MNGTHHIIKPNNKVGGQNCNASEINNIVLYKRCVAVVRNDTRLKQQVYQHSHIAHNGEFNSNIPHRHQRNALDINGEVYQDVNDDSYTKDPEENFLRLSQGLVIRDTVIPWALSLFLHPRLMGQRNYITPMIINTITIN